ncbi:MAG: hypothetical protein NTZ83_01850 [Candidatus Pacearchaeota archaeon]|nr:hypothetical protein [Candidatus Pacearchaeota archaeon]
MTKAENYKKLLEDAAWKADPDFKYSFLVNDISKYKDRLKSKDGKEFLASGEISLKKEEENFSYVYGFTFGTEKMIFLELSEALGGRKGDFRKKMHNDIIDFNEKLTINVGSTKIRIIDEKSEKVRNLYLSRGYATNKNSRITLEKTLK